MNIVKLEKRGGGETSRETKNSETPLLLFIIFYNWVQIH